MFISQLENSDKLRFSSCFFFFFSNSFRFGVITEQTITLQGNSNIVNIVPVQKHMSQDAVRKHQHRQRWQLFFFYSSSIDFSISFSLRTNSWASLSPMRASNILMIGFSGGESKQMRAPPTPDTNILRLNGFSCCIGEVIGNPELHPLDFQEANIMFV